MILRLRLSPATIVTVPPAASTRVASSVASAAAGMRGPQDVGPEGLRRLHGHQLAAVGGSAVAAPDRVCQSDHGDGCVGAVAHA